MREFEGLGFRIRVPSPPATHCPTPTLALAPTITHITTHAHTHTRTPTPTHTHTHSHSSMQTRSILKPYSPMKRDLRTSEVTRYCGQSCPLTHTYTHVRAHPHTHPPHTNMQSCADAEKVDSLHKKLSKISRLASNPVLQKFSKASR